MAEATPQPMPDFDKDELDLHNLFGRPRPSCPPLDLLLAYREDVLPPELTETLRLHLVDCRLCPRLLVDFDSLPEPQLSAAHLDRMEAKLVAPTFRSTARTRSYAFAGIAALLMLAVLLTFSVRSRQASSPSVASVAPPPRTVAALEIPISPLAPPANILLTRGGQAGEDPAADRLMPAFTAYNSGNYAAAADRFAQLRSRYPQSEVVALYLGISQLYVHQDAAAYTTLTSLRSPHADSVDAVHWYTAVAAERTHAANAQQLFAEICANKASTYSIDSCKIESQLR